MISRSSFSEPMRTNVKGLPAPAGAGSFPSPLDARGSAPVAARRADPLRARSARSALMLIAAAVGLAAYLIGKRGKEAGK